MILACDSQMKSGSSPADLTGTKRLGLLASMWTHLSKR